MVIRVATELLGDRGGLRVFVSARYRPTGSLHADKAFFFFVTRCCPHYCLRRPARSRRRGGGGKAETLLQRNRSTVIQLR